MSLGVTLQHGAQSRTGALISLDGLDRAAAMHGSARVSRGRLRLGSAADGEQLHDVVLVEEGLLARVLQIVSFAHFVH